VTAVTEPRDLLRIADLTAAELTALLDLAAAMKARPHHWSHVLAGKSVACYFSKPSTRTRVSMETAVHRLGGLPIMLRPEELQLSRGESIEDTARVLSGFCAAIVVRTFAQAEVVTLARAASVPVVNALTDAHHPCQALADLMTLRERFGALRGLRLAYIGDGNNVAASLMEAGALAGMHVTVATPQAMRPDPEVVRRAERIAEEHGGSVELRRLPGDAVRGAHAVYTDVWVSMGETPVDGERHRLQLAPFHVGAMLMRLADPDAVFMHCLPAHRGEEVGAEVIDGPRSVVFQQAANRLPTAQAVLRALVTGEWSASA
jgi:ornithine carbamoyltransferase